MSPDGVALNFLKSLLLNEIFNGSNCNIILSKMYMYIDNIVLIKSNKKYSAGRTKSYVSTYIPHPNNASFEHCHDNQTCGCKSLNMSNYTYKYTSSNERYWY